MAKKQEKEISALVISVDATMPTMDDVKDGELL